MSAGPVVFAIAIALVQDPPRPVPETAPPQAPAAKPVAPPAADLVPAQAPQTPSQRLAALKKEFDDAQRAFDEKYAAAKSEPEREALFKSDYPSPELYVPRFVAFAKEFRGEEVALDGWMWIAQHVQGREQIEPCLEAVASDHAKSPRLVEFIQSVSSYNATIASEMFLRAVLEKSPHWEVKGHATFKLAAVLNGLAATAKSLAAGAGDGESAAGTGERMSDFYGKEMIDELAARDPDEMRREAEDLFEDVLADFKAVKSLQGTLGQQAEAELFELRNLAIGRAAPEIVGQDVDGVVFKLSDYRGKVVVLDFWGFW